MDDGHELPHCFEQLCIDERDMRNAFFFRVSCKCSQSESEEVNGILIFLSSSFVCIFIRSDLPCRFHQRIAGRFGFFGA